MRKAKAYRLLRRTARRLINYTNLQTARRRFRRARTPAEVTADRSQQPVVFFAPNAGFPSMLTAPAIVAKTLAEKGYPVLVVSCGMALRTCTVMDGLAPFAQRPTRDFCTSCMNYASSSVNRYGLPMVDLGDLLTPAIRAEAARQLDAWDGSPQDFIHEGAPIGAFAAGNLSAIWKRELLDNEDEITTRRIRVMTEECLAVKLAMHDFLVRVNARHLIYYAEYAFELSVAAVCEALGVKVTPVYHSSLNGNDFRRVAFIDKVPTLFDGRRRREDWPEWRPLAIDASQVGLIADDTVARLLGRSGIVFSPALGEGGSDLFSSLGLTRDRKVLVAFTSSDDEHNNVKKVRALFGFPFKKLDWPFVDQADWLRQLCQHVSNSDDLQLVVRFHPRLGQGRGTTAVADYGDQLAAVEGAFKHVHVIRPEEKISSYGLAEISDVVLTAWTSLGPESARLGMPVVQSFFGENSFPVGGFLRCPTTPEAYFAEVRNAVDVPPDPQMLREVFRFSSMYFTANEVDLGDLVPRFDDPKLPEFKMPDAAADVERFSVGGIAPQKQRLKDLQAAQTVALHEQEAAALRAAMARFVHVLAFCSDPSEPLDLELSDAATNPGRQAERTIFVSADIHQVTVSLGEKKVVKRSPMIANLAKLAATLKSPERAVQ